MSTATQPLHRTPPRAWAWASAEVAAIFLLFALQGSWPPPDVNEPYYLVKAAHYWRADYAPGDVFLDSADTHQVFYFTLGWLARWMSLEAMAWTGRIVTWLGLAVGWRWLSVGIVDRRGISILTAALFATLSERYHMAGEWVIGGVEAKGLAYVALFVALGTLVRGRWRATWLLLGVSSALHVLVGGWGAVAAGIAWLTLKGDRPALRSMLPAMALGAILSLPGLLPSLALNRGVEPAIVNQANQIYVFHRLAHHLDPAQFPWNFIVRFGLLTALAGVLWHRLRAEAATRRLAAFVLGTVVLAAIGCAIGWAARFDHVRAAALLRFYWFRLSDTAVPVGVAVMAGRVLAGWLATRAAAGWLGLGFAIIGAGLHLGEHARARILHAPAIEDQWPYYAEWVEACQWVGAAKEIPPDARFLTPIMSQTFKWYAGRAEVGNWKEIPQDARAMVLWWRRLRDAYSTGSDPPGRQWYLSLPDRGAATLQRLAARYKANYLIALKEPALPWPTVYQNGAYAVYRIR